MGMFPPMDFTRFDWKAKPDDPSFYSRLAFCGETYEEVLNRFNSGEQTLFLGAYVSFTHPISTTDLLARVRQTWEALRFEVPTIAAGTEFNESYWHLFLTYRLAKSSDEVREWSKRTVRLAEGVKDLDELRYEVGKQKNPDQNGEQTFMYILPTSETSYGFLLHTHHAPFDGSAIQTLMTRFLAKLMKPSSESIDSLPWGTENTNLPPPACAILAKTEPTEGPLYEQGVGAILNSYANFKRGFGFKERKKFGPGHSARVHLEFSEDETTRLVKAVRVHGGTLNQFAHAAVCIVCHLDNPTTKDTPPDAAYVSFGLTNCKDRLLPEHRLHIGYALGIHSLTIPASIVASAASKGEKDQLIKVAQVAKEAYEEMSANPALISGMPQVGDFFLESVRKAPIVPNYGFCFAGDGVGEKHLNRTYEGPDGQVAATIDDYFTSLNMHNPGPFFRAFTWRGKLRLSIDYNEYVMPRDAVQGFVEKWASLLRLLL